MASQLAIAASARATFNWANSRALADRPLPSAAASCMAIWFQWPGGVTVPSPSAQNRAVCVSSAVRVDPVARPFSLTSLKAAAYASLPRAGGAAGRNWSGELRANGVTSAHCGSRASAYIGVVGCQAPGPPAET